MEAFFVVAIAAVIVGFGVLALWAVRRIAAYRNVEPSPHPRSSDADRQKDRQ